MKKNLDFKKLFLPMAIANVAVALIGALMLFIFSGKTYAEYTLNNLRFGLVLKGVFFLLFVFIVTSLYFFIRFKKKGLRLGIISVATASVNSLVSVAFCVICRANLGELTFVTMLISFLLTYMTALIFEVSVGPDDTQKKKKKSSAEDSELTLDKASQKAFNTMLIPLVLLVLTVVAASIVSLIFSVFSLALYALPVILSAVMSVVTTNTSCCKFYKD